MKTAYTNAEVYMGREMFCSAFLVEDGCFAAVGSTADAAGWQAEETIDLGGKFVCAGFNDSHMHLLNYGQALTMAPLHEHTGSLSDMLDCLRSHLINNPPEDGQWLTGRGWNQDFFRDVRRMPTRFDLDQVSREVPIMAVRACGHAIVLNSKALEICGITPETEPVPGGEIVTENGQPNGILMDNAMDYAYDCLPAPTEQMVADMIRAACRALNRYGVTSCHSDDYAVFAGEDWQMVNRVFHALEEAGELTVRVYEQCNFSQPEALQEFLAAGNRTGTGTDRFRIGPLKLVADGALGARTAWVTESYADDPGNTGLPCYTTAQLDALISLAHRSGMQTAVHCIGDACLDAVISAMEKARKECPREDTRSGIVHCQITRADQLRKLGAMKAHIYAQSIFLDYDSRIVKDRVGEKTASTSYSWKTLMKMGATVSNGTDCPVELPFALGGIQCAVTRQPLDGQLPPYLTEEAFTVAEALDSYTCAGAFASFEESSKGQIQPGMLADFTVLERSPFAVPENKISDIPIRAVYLGGTQLF